MVKKKFIRNILTMFLLTVSMLTVTSCDKAKTANIQKDHRIDAFREKQLTEETLHFYFPGVEPDGMKDVIKEIEERLKPTLNVKLDFKWYFSKPDYLNSVKSSLSQGVNIDAFILNKNNNTDEIDEMVRTNSLADLTPIIAKSAPKLWGAYTDEQKLNVTYDEKVMAIPQLYPNINRICAVVRDDMMKKYSIPDIKTYEDFERFLETIRREEKGNYPPMFLEKNAFDLFGEANGYVNVDSYLVYKRDDPNMKLIPWEQTDEFRKGMQTIEGWSNNNYIVNYESVTSVTDVKADIHDPLEYIMRGFAAATLVDLNDLYQEHTLIEAEEPKLRFYPLYPEKTYTDSLNISAIAVNKNAKDPERIVKFLECVYSNPEIYNLLMYGIEGKNYVVKGDSFAFPPNIVKFYGWDGSYIFSNIKSMKKIENVPIDFSEEFKKAITAVPRYAPSAGIKVIKNSIESYIEGRMKNYDDFQGQVKKKNLEADKDIPLFIKKQQEVGLNKIIEEVQKQLDDGRGKND